MVDRTILTGLWTAETGKVFSSEHLPLHESIFLTLANCLHIFSADLQMQGVAEGRGGLPEEGVQPKTNTSTGTT